METENKIKTDRGPVIGGVVFIVAGILLLLEKTGHLPQIETPGQLLDAIREFVHDGASARPA